MTPSRRRRPHLAGAFFCMILAGMTWWGTAAAGALEEALPGLADRAFPAKQQAVQALAATGDSRALPILEALLAGDLYTREAADPPLVLARPSAAGLRLSDPLTGVDLGEVERATVKKIPLNNALRTALRGGIAALTLSSPDPAVRSRAAKDLMRDPSPESVTALRARLEQEQDAAVRTTLVLAVAVADLRVGTPEARLAAVATLEGSLYPEARNGLTTLIANETDADVKAAAERALTAIDARLTWNARAETLFFGLSLGSVLVLAAIGLAITFGVMGVINMAHGELMMLGAYTTYLVQQALPGWVDYSLFVAIPAAFIVSGLFGIAIERTVIRFLYGRPLETLLATFGISLILQQLVRTTISAQNVAVENPSWMSGSLQINPALALTYNRLYILAFALLVFVALLLILKRTALGLQVRAVSQNRAMARAMGVRSARVDALTFGLGAGIAGVAGVALSQLTNVGPNMGQAYIIDSFMVVVFGGVGNLWGTLIGGMTLGVANKFMEPWAGAVLAKILVLVFIILFIQKRPRGLFPQRGRAADG
ncbi:urea ABC transporter permease subunit UrtB [Lamprocystis purpurea]|uniref:urea ABC transporter permease subunit UrtB n=1 Tax=Lamprocystis purpurea TaxID=61598 RepID=UPI001FE07884|nr:urea ABC transporter permease subunit UrtB [Lamprocystis purpurea]